MLERTYSYLIDPRTDRGAWLSHFLPWFPSKLMLSNYRAACGFTKKPEDFMGENYSGPDIEQYALLKGIDYEMKNRGITVEMFDEVLKPTIDVEADGRTYREVKLEDKIRLFEFVSPILDSLVKNRNLSIFPTAEYFFEELLQESL